MLLPLTHLIYLHDLRVIPSQVTIAACGTAVVVVAAAAAGGGGSTKRASRIRSNHGSVFADDFFFLAFSTFFLSPSTFISLLPAGHERNPSQ